MEAWRKLAIILFPEHKSDYSKADTIYSILSDLEDIVDEAHRQNHKKDLARIYKFAEWCFSQKDTDPEIWNAAAMTFYEHLLDSDQTLFAIPYWVKPDMFQEKRHEYENRMELERRGATFYKLLDLYTEVDGTDFE